MWKLTKNASFLLLSAAVGMAGCASPETSDQAHMGVEDEEQATDALEGAGGATQFILPGQDVWRATNGKCVTAVPAGKKLRLSGGCKKHLGNLAKMPAQFVWTFNTNFWQIRSAKFGGKCVTLPVNPANEVTLEDCDPGNNPYQWFQLVPTTNSHGPICGTVGAGAPIRCLTYQGNKLYSAPPGNAPDWYRVS